jgi:hypothetical protein
MRPEGRPATNELEWKMKRFAPLLAFALLALTPSVAVADHGTDSASGRGRIFGNTEIDFSARSSSVGTNARGRASLSFTNSDPDQTYSGEVTCLNVVGATPTTPAMATIGVLVTKAPFGSTVQSLVLSVSDGGKFSGVPDTATYFMTSAPPPPDGACPAPFGGFLFDGEITIHDSL